jgi:hypothetical protein
MNVSHKFAQRRAPVALVVAVTGMIGMALVAYFASDLVEFFATASASSAMPDFYPTPITRAP